MRVYVYVLDRECPFVGMCRCMFACTHNYVVCVGQRMPIGVNACVCMYMYMYMYDLDRKCRLCACTCRYMGKQSYVDACVVHVHVWDREYPFVMRLLVRVDACVCMYMYLYYTAWADQRHRHAFICRSASASS